MIVTRVTAAIVAVAVAVAAAVTLYVDVAPESERHSQLVLPSPLT